MVWCCTWRLKRVVYSFILQKCKICEVVSLICISMLRIWKEASQILLEMINSRSLHIMVPSSSSYIESHSVYIFCHDGMICKDRLKRHFVPSHYKNEVLSLSLTYNIMLRTWKEVSCCKSYLKGLSCGVKILT